MIYPAYIPPEVISAYESWQSDDLSDVAQRLIFRPSMQKVYVDLGKVLTGIPSQYLDSVMDGPQLTPWQVFFDTAVSTIDSVEMAREKLKLRAELARRIKSVGASCQSLLDDLAWIGDLRHGLLPPDELFWTHAIEAIANASASWDSESAEVVDGFDKISRKYAPARQYAKEFAETLSYISKNNIHGFPSPDRFNAAHVVSYANIARIARAALNYPDAETSTYRPFGARDVIDALK
jgi:hypothetical protein